MNSSKRRSVSAVLSAVRKGITGKCFEKWYRPILCGIFLVVLFFTGLETARIAPVALVGVLGISIGMVFCRNTQYLTLPFLLLSLLLIFCYDSYDFFIGYVWLLPIVLIALGVHIWRLKPRFLRGESFYPLCAVALATMLGGVGFLSRAEYFTPVVLFYVFGLGPGLVLVYLLLKNEVRLWARGALCADLAALGVCAAIIVLTYRAIELPKILAQGGVFEPQWSNNISTMLFFTVPALFLLAKRRMYYLPIGIVALAAAALSGSRSGLVVVPILLAACFFWLWITEPRENYIRHSWFRCFFILTCMALVGGVALMLGGWMPTLMPKGNEPRAQFAVRSIKDLKEAPLFGKGLGYRGNKDIYNSKKGGINWYHMFVPQILGSLGLCGAVAWLWQLVCRARIAVRRIKSEVFVYALCYLGLFLMSQVNPGEFCPIPYAFCAVLFFVMLEQREEIPLPA